VKSWKGFRSVFLLSVLMADVVLCGASMAADLDYDAMIESADFIVVGDVTRIHNDTYTYVSIAISEFVTNPQNMSQVTITIGGEVYDGVGCTGDTPHDLFYVGERVLVFVKKVGPYYRVLYGEAGKYSVREGAPNVGLTLKTVIDNWSTPVDYHPLLAFNESVKDPVPSGGTEDEVLTEVNPWCPVADNSTATLAEKVERNPPRLVVSPYEPGYLRVVVEEGDWVEYSTSIFLRSKEWIWEAHGNETKGSVSECDYETTVSVLDVTGTDVTFREERRHLNGSVQWQQTVTGDPTVPHYSDPFHRIGDLFIPADLNAGEAVPQNLVFIDAEGDIIDAPWSQYINETVSMRFLGVKREVNHIYWSRYIHAFDGESTVDYHQEKDVYYDKKTGVMLQSFYNYTKIYDEIYDRELSDRETWDEPSILAGTYIYDISDTNLWSVPPWARREIQIVAAASLSFIALLTYLRWREKI
jgi:hypothetical protein